MRLQAIKQEMYDGDLYEDMLDFSPNLKEIVARGIGSLATFNNLTQDIYLALFKLNPELNADEDMKPDYLVNKKLLMSLIENQDFQRLHSFTKLDSVGSGLGAQVLAERLLEELENQNNDEQSDNEGDTDVVDLITGNQDKINDACRSALEEVSEAVEMAKAWGIDPGDPSARVSYRSKKQALERLRSNPKLKQLTNMVGRLRQVALKCYRRSTDEASSIKEVSVGSELEKVLPSEKMLLANNITQKDFYRRYHQRELIQYQYDGTPRGRGPIVVCCDVSGSMRGKPEQWSKAMVIALAEVAQQERRDFACILFNSKLVGTWTVPRGTWDPGALIDMAETFPGGGTSFEYPLEKSIELINTSRFKQADIVFITDGKCDVPEELLNKLKKVKQRKDFIVVTVLINMKDSDAGSVQEFRMRLSIFPLSLI